MTSGDQIDIVEHGGRRGSPDTLRHRGTLLHGSAEWTQ